MPAAFERPGNPAVSARKKAQNIRARSGPPGVFCSSREQAHIHKIFNELLHLKRSPKFPLWYNGKNIIMRKESLF